MKVFLDTNILIDIMVDYRENHAVSLAVCRIARKGGFTAAVSTQSVIDASYVILHREKLPIMVFKRLLLDLLKTATPYGIGPIDINEAIESPISDFEDAAQIACAVNSGCSVMVSSDRKLKDNGRIPVLTPSEFLSRVFGE